MYIRVLFSTFHLPRDTSPPNLSICCEKQTCLDRTCSNCGVEKVGDILQSNLQSVLADRCTWEKWQNSTVKSTKKKKKVLVDVNGSVQDCIDDLCKQAAKFSLHLFTAKWQRDQLNCLKKNVPAQLVGLEDRGTLHPPEI